MLMLLALDRPRFGLFRAPHLGPRARDQQVKNHRYHTAATDGRTLLSADSRSTITHTRACAACAAHAACRMPHAACSPFVFLVRHRSPPILLCQVFPSLRGSSSRTRLATSWSVARWTSAGGSAMCVYHGALPYITQTAAARRRLSEPSLARSGARCCAPACHGLVCQTKCIRTAACNTRHLRCRPPAHPPCTPTPHTRPAHPPHPETC